jgi:ubiquinone/menaquinone biosynthesis C-methylase UbiE
LTALYYICPTRDCLLEMPGLRMTHLYDNIGVGYDTTRRPDPYLAHRLWHHLGMQEGGVYLDVACGTGNYTTVLASRGGVWHGIDQSRHMIRSAQQKSGLVNWYQGDVAALPFKDRTFSGAFITCAIHHFESLSEVFAQVYRVMGSGRFVIFTTTPQQTRGYWLNEYFPAAMEKSVDQLPALDVVESALLKAGFRMDYTETYEVQPDLQDFFLYSGKHRPEMYLSKAVRRGISTFASLADPAEVATGCQRLRADIESGRIYQVIQWYRHDQGDYLFIVAAKDG